MTIKMPSIIRSTESLIHQLWGLHKICLEREHGINKEDDWEIFEPTKFIYSYFSFNSIYSYDWEKSFWKRTPHSRDRKIKEETKIKETIETFYEELSNDFKKKFQKSLKNYMFCDSEEVMKILDEIKTDSLIDKDVKNRFTEDVEKILVEKISNNEVKDRLNNILKFIYKVRNNIFHGTKTTVDMAGEEQKKRLKIYTAILLSTNELLFVAAKEALGMSLKQGIGDDAFGKL